MDGQPQSQTVTVMPPDEGGALVPLRFRHDGWHAGVQRRFLTALGETGCIRDACRAVGRSSTSAYKLRARSAEFAAQWDRALEMAATVLEQVAFQRAVTGVEEPVYHYGKYLGTRRRYSDGLLRLLILRGDLKSGRLLTQAEKERAAHEAARVAGGTFGTEVTHEQLVETLSRRLDAIARHRRDYPERYADEDAEDDDDDCEDDGLGGTRAPDE